MASLQHRVRYHEVDQQGYLFNGRYFEIADVGLTEFIRCLGWTYPELNKLGADPSVVRAEAEFQSPARFDEVLDVCIDCTRVGRSSFDLRVSINRDTESVAVINMTYVNVDAAAGRALALPELFADALREALVVDANEGVR